MTQNNDHAMMEEIVLPEHLLPLGSVLGQGVSALDLCMVLAKIFRVQYTEVALLRLERGSAALCVSRILAHHGRDSAVQQSGGGAHGSQQEGRDFQQLCPREARQHLRNHQTGSTESDEPARPSPIQKLMSVPIMDRDSAVVGVIQISRKGLDPKFAQDFSREDLHDLELVAGLLATAPALLAN